MEMIGYCMNVFGNLLLGLKFLHFVFWVWHIYIYILVLVLGIF